MGLFGGLEWDGIGCDDWEAFCLMHGFKASVTYRMTTAAKAIVLVNCTSYLE